MANPLTNASSSISSMKGKADDKKFQMDMMKQQYEAQKNKAEAAKKLAETRNLAFADSNDSALGKIRDQKDKAEKAKGSVEQRQREYGQAQELVKSILEKIEQQAKGGK